MGAKSTRWPSGRGRPFCEVMCVSGHYPPTSQKRDFACGRYEGIFVCVFFFLLFAKSVLPASQKGVQTFTKTVCKYIVIIALFSNRSNEYKCISK